MSDDVESIVPRLRTAAKSITYAELYKVCVFYFGQPRQKGTSHCKFKTGIRDPALVNIQASGKMAKPYQCRQVADAIEAKTAGKKTPGGSGS